MLLVKNCHPLTAGKQQRVAINDPLHDLEIAMRCGLVWWVEESGKQRNENDTGERPTTSHGGAILLAYGNRQEERIACLP